MDTEYPKLEELNTKLKDYDQIMASIETIKMQRKDIIGKFVTRFSKIMEVLLFHGINNIDINDTIEIHIEALKNETIKPQDFTFFVVIKHNLIDQYGKSIALKYCSEEEIIDNDQVVLSIFKRISYIQVQNHFIYNNDKDKGQKVNSIRIDAPLYLKPSVFRSNNLVSNLYSFEESPQFLAELTEYVVSQILNNFLVIISDYINANLIGKFKSQLNYMANPTFEIQNK